MAQDCHIRKEVSMKKTTIFVLLLVASMILGVTAAATAASRADFWAPINQALNKLQAAVEKGDNKARDIALTEVKNNVYNGMRYLASVNAYDPRALQIIDYANKFTETKDIYDLAQAHAFNNLVFGADLMGPQDSFFFQDHS